MSVTRWRTAWLAAFVAVTGAAQWIADDVDGTPLYAARAGRTCDNCHLEPKEWVDPHLPDRKCTLSCQACHVDPAGGGMRTAPGRFFQSATVPAVAFSARPTQDWDRGILLGRRDRVTTYSAELPLGPNDFAAMPAYRDSVRSLIDYGTVPGPESKHALWAGRYGFINPDPLIRLGWDVRFAGLFSGTGLFFPMQIDLPLLLRPYRHASLFLNPGASGRNDPYADTFVDDAEFYLREAFLLVHELPYQAYAKVGRFVPAYGLRLEDHTAFIRRELELDGSLQEARVSGVEFGAAPNYPYVNWSIFRSASRQRQPDAWNVTDVDDGFGTALNLGWRGLAWSLGGSYLRRDRPLEEGGDLTAFSLQASLNPWRRFPRLPLTWQGEVDFGRRQSRSGRDLSFFVSYQSLDWLLGNGVNWLVVAHDFMDPDRDVIDDEAHRLQTGLQVTPIPGVTLDARLRTLVPSAGGSDSDLFLQLRLWN